MLSGVTVIKVGGAELEQPGWLERFAAAVRRRLPAVIVHGGGHAISRWQRALGLSLERRDGLRVTSPELAEVVEMVLCGPVREALVRALRAQGVEAVGISGADGSLRVELEDPERLGRVGRVIGVETARLVRLLEAGLTPVLAPAARGPDGQPVNVNADQAAAGVARALGAAALLVVSDVPGVLRDGQPLRSVSLETLEDLIARGVVRDGMLVKLRAAAAAAPVPVRVGDLAVLTDPAAGTAITAGGSRL